MILNTRGRTRTRSGYSSGTPASPRLNRSRAPILEALESRRLLAYLGPSTKLPVTTSTGEYLIQVAGPGAVSVQPAGQGTINLTVYGTTTASTITITQIQPRYHIPGQFLVIRHLFVRTRQLGGLTATPMELDGRMTPLTNSMNNLDVGELGPDARVDLVGGLDELSATSVVLGPLGSVSIGQGINTASPTPVQSASFTLGTVTFGTMSLNGGRFAIGADTTQPITVQGNLTVSQSGQFLIGRDEAGSLTVGGSLAVDSGGQFLVGRNLDDLTVSGNLIIGPASGIAVEGEVNDLTVNGYFQGQGGTTNPSAIDLGVGLNISGLTILSGVPGQGGLINANIRAGGSIGGVDIPYGAYKSTIQSSTSMAT
jgi:hypothetical protein